LTIVRYMCVLAFARASPLVEVHHMSGSGLPMSAAAEAPPPCVSRRAERSRPPCISQRAEPNRLTQAGAAAVEVAAEHTDARAPGDWRGAPPRSALDARACQPLPQVRGALARVGQQIAEAACQRGARLARRAESGAYGALKGMHRQAWGAGHWEMCSRCGWVLLSTSHREAHLDARGVAASLLRLRPLEAQGHPWPRSPHPAPFHAAWQFYRDAI